MPVISSTFQPMGSIIGWKDNFFLKFVQLCIWPEEIISSAEIFQFLRL